MDSKKCIRCGSNKQLSEFYPRKWKRVDGTQVIGLDGWCIPCRLYYHKDTYTRALQEGNKWKYAGELVNRMRDRTKKNKYQENVEWTTQEVFEVIENGCCVITSIPFRCITTGSNKIKNPFNPSPDRIDNSKGYTKENTQWVVFIYNAMRNNFNAEDVKEFITALKSI